MGVEGYNFIYSGESNEICVLTIENVWLVSSGYAFGLSFKVYWNFIMIWHIVRDDLVCKSQIILKLNKMIRESDEDKSLLDIEILAVEI